jgi:hypothetical protein
VVTSLVHSSKLGNCQKLFPAGESNNRPSRLPNQSFQIKSKTPLCKKELELWWSHYTWILSCRFAVPSLKHPESHPLHVHIKLSPHTHATPLCNFLLVSF